MPSLHCLSLPTPSSIHKNSTPNTPQIQSHPNLSAKPSSLPPLKPPLQIPPNLSSHSNLKILSLEIMGIDSARALSLNPNLLSASPDSIHSLISFLLSKGIPHKDLPRILNMCPKLLTSNITKDLAPVFAFLSTHLNIPNPSLRRTIKKCPRLLASGVPDQLLPALVYLRRLGFRDLTALALSDPVLFVLSVENTLAPKLGYLMGLGLRREEAAGMVLRCPSLLTFSIENNFKPKYAYFVNEMGRGLEEVREFPQCFGFSLEKRIKMRHREMAAVGLRLPLSAMLKSSDDEFKELLVMGDG